MRANYPDWDKSYLGHRRMCLELLASIREITARIDEVKFAVNHGDLAPGQPDKRKRLLERALALITSRRCMIMSLHDITGEHPDTTMRSRNTTESCNPFDNNALRFESLRIHSCRNLGRSEDAKSAPEIQPAVTSPKRNTVAYFRIEEKYKERLWWQRVKKVLTYKLF